MSLEFVKHHGFQELWRNVTQRLSVEGVDIVDRLRTALGQLTERGIAITTLAEEMRQNPDHLQDLYELSNLIHVDVPRAGYSTPVSFEEFSDVYSHDAQLPDGYFLATRGEKYIGLSYLRATDGDPLCLEVV